MGAIAHHRRLKIIVLSVLTCLLVTACGTIRHINSPNVSVASNCQIVKHDVGETQICGQPETIAALSPPLLDILLSLGIQPAAYAEVNPLSDRVFSRPSEQIPYLGKRVTSQPVNLGDRQNPSIETLLQLKPNLILGENYLEINYKLYSKIAPTLLYEVQGDRWQQVILQIGQALGREAQAQQTLINHNQRLAQIKAQLAPVIAQQKILVLGFANEISSSFLFDRNDFVCGLLADLGFQVVNPEEERSSGIFSVEVLPQIDTDVILVLPSGENTVENAKRQWSQNSILRSLPAVQNQKVYFIDYQLTRIRGPIAAEVLINRIQELLQADKIKTNP
ncbi:iron dicitrate-binding protein [Gloeocapsopsis sp. IPPAS B-1203]|nr:iron dicitrate-binding protein [Gloeocapsopsis sp. IPPAS B-1203]